jgi:hypothetical protein
LRIFLLSLKKQPEIPVGLGKTGRIAPRFLCKYYGQIRTLEAAERLDMSQRAAAQRVQFVSAFQCRHDTSLCVFSRDTF